MVLIAAFKERANLDYHLKYVHSEERNFICQECGDNFKSMKTLQNHHIRIHGAGERCHTCEICGKSFYRNNELLAHLHVHTGHKPFLCNFCGLSFRDRSCKKRHEDIHTGLTRYQCHRCGKGYARRDHYRLHVNKCGVGNGGINKMVDSSSHFGSHLESEQRGTRIADPLPQNIEQELDTCRSSKKIQTDKEHEAGKVHHNDPKFSDK